MNCDYCGEKTERTVEAVEENVPVCHRCAILLSSPMTGSRLIRGHMNLRLREKMGKRQLDLLFEKAMPILESMKRKDAS
jgi:hypothetical protein